MERTSRWLILLMALALAFVAPVFSQTGFSQSGADPGADQGPASAGKRAHKQKKSKGPGKEMGQGGADIGKGAAKGAGDLGKGAAGGAGNLVTGHPVNATVSVGKGVGGAAKNVGVGTGKGVAKIGKGIGGEFKKIGGKKPAKKDEGTGE